MSLITSGIHRVGTMHEIHSSVGYRLPVTRTEGSNQVPTLANLKHAMWTHVKSSCVACRPHRKQRYECIHACMGIYFTVGVSWGKWKGLRMEKGNRASPILFVIFYFLG